jgi:hypothetical protein
VIIAGSVLTSENPDFSPGPGGAAAAPAAARWPVLAQPTVNKRDARVARCLSMAGQRAPIARAYTDPAGDGKTNREALPLWG